VESALTSERDAGRNGSLAEIAFEAPGAVRETLARLGRTEDVRFAPGGRRLAIACYERNSIAIADLTIAGHGSITVERVQEYRSDALRDPHGVDFVDPETVVVANRVSGLSAFRLAEGDALVPIATLGRDVHHVPRVPGSVAVRPGDRPEILVCDNAESVVARYVLDAGSIAGGELVASRWLDLPDGLSLAGDERLLAVSSHDTHSVVIHALEGRADADPIAVLRGVRYPHGLRFFGEDRYVVVADAGAPFVHVFSRPHAGWGGVEYPAFSLRVMDDELFTRGHHNLQEGGPKGVDVHPATEILAVTCEERSLAFFDLGAAVDAGADAPSPDALLQYELHVVERFAAAKRAAQAQVAALENTALFRVAAPARRAYATVRGLLSRNGSA
jgi:hypothetical protein